VTSPRGASRAWSSRGRRVTDGPIPHLSVRSTLKLAWGRVTERDAYGECLAESALAIWTPFVRLEPRL
jgi:hypothetical protein